VLPLLDLQFTNKPCAQVFDAQGNYDFYPIRLIKRRLFVLKEFGVVCHINPKFGNKRFKGKKSTWFYDMAKSEGVGSPFDPQKKFNPDALKPLKGQSRLRIKSRTLAKVIHGRIVEPKVKPTNKNDDDDDVVENNLASSSGKAPKYESTKVTDILEEPRPFTDKEAKNLEKKLKKMKTTEEQIEYLEDNGISVIDNITMEGAEFEDDGGFDDEDVLFAFSEELLNTEKQGRDMSSKKLMPKFKMMQILPIVFVIIIVIVALPTVINNFGSIQLPKIDAKMFSGGHFLLGLASKIPFLSHFI